MLEYKDKNTKFSTVGNEDADILLCMIEANSVLSLEFTAKITNSVLVIISNLERNEQWVIDEIKNLKEQMTWLNIFSEKFINQINSQLLLAYSFEKNKIKE